MNDSNEQRKHKETGKCQNDTKITNSDGISPFIDYYVTNSSNSINPNQRRVIFEIPVPSNPMDYHLDDDDNDMDDVRGSPNIGNASKLSMNVIRSRFQNEILVPLLANPILCQGSSFQLQCLEDIDGTHMHPTDYTDHHPVVHTGNKNRGLAVVHVYTDIYSPNPTLTADAIAKRLQKRLNDNHLLHMDDICRIS